MSKLLWSSYEAIMIISKHWPAHGQSKLQCAEGWRKPHLGRWHKPRVAREYQQPWRKSRENLVITISEWFGLKHSLILGPTRTSRWAATVAICRAVRAPYPTCWISAPPCSSEVTSSPLPYTTETKIPTYHILNIVVETQLIIDIFNKINS